MKPLTVKQIQGVIDWMNTWEQLKKTAIPIRFKEDFSDDGLGSKIYWNELKFSKPLTKKEWYLLDEAGHYHVADEYQRSWIAKVTPIIEQLRICDLKIAECMARATIKESEQENKALQALKAVKAHYKELLNEMI